MPSPGRGRAVVCVAAAGVNFIDTYPGLDTEALTRPVMEAACTGAGCSSPCEASSGPVPPVDPQRLNRGGPRYLTRPGLDSYTATRDELEARATDVFRLVADGSLDITIDSPFPLAEAKARIRRPESRHTSGKVLLIP